MDSMTIIAVASIVTAGLTIAIGVIGPSLGEGRAVATALTSLAQGEAIAAGEAVPMPVRFRVTMPDPPPNAQSIEYGHMWSRGPTETDVENIVDSWRRQRR